MALPRTVNLVKDKPESGTIHFTNLHLASLQNKFGADWLLSAPDRCNRNDVEFIQYALKVAGKRNNSAGINLEDIDESVTMGDIAAAVLDAIFIANFGMTFEQRQVWMAEQIKKIREEDEKPPT